MQKTSTSLRLVEVHVYMNIYNFSSKHTKACIQCTPHPLNEQPS